MTRPTTQDDNQRRRGKRPFPPSARRAPPLVKSEPSLPELATSVPEDPLPEPLESLPLKLLEAEAGAAAFVGQQCRQTEYRVGSASSKTTRSSGFRTVTQPQPPARWRRADRRLGPYTTMELPPQSPRPSRRG